MTRGRTKKGRARAEARRVVQAARPLLGGTDYGDALVVTPKTVGASGERWTEPFLEANRPALRRLCLEPAVRYQGGALCVRLTPGPRVGAIALRAPTTRRVVAGVLLRPRFRWSSVGRVLGALGFGIGPTLGGGPLVPGSAREVPPWLLAGPVLRRLADLLAHLRRGFVPMEAVRTTPRGRLDVRRYTTESLPSGRWHHLPCHFSEPVADPRLLAGMRWTLDRLLLSLTSVSTSGPSRPLLERAQALLDALGPGPRTRPVQHMLPAGSSALAQGAMQAMEWVAEERGLGGARILDGLAWDLAIDEVWERWVSRVFSDIAPSLGLTAAKSNPRHPLMWSSGLRSMSALVPDLRLWGARRAVWVDAKYKAHLHQLRRVGWSGLSDEIKAAHRADLHQALAYASLADVDDVDTLLVYPAEHHPAPEAVATVRAGRRRVRLVLLGIPFGFESPTQHDALRNRLRVLLRRAP